MPGGHKGRRLRAVPALDAHPLTNYDGAFLICRESHRLPLGTRADHWNDETDERGQLLGWRRTLMCERCSAIVTDRMDTSGRVRRAIRYPAGYSIPRDVGGVITRRDVRLERVRRMREGRAAG